VATTSVIAIVAIILVLAQLLPGFGHGYDLSDEGLYLISSDAPGDDFALSGFFGLYLDPLYSLVGHSVAALRVAGVAVLGLTGAYSGWSLGRLLEFRLGFTALPIRLGAAAIGTIGAWSYYSIYLLTPSYNWLALVGMLLSLGGLFRILARDRVSRRAAAGLTLLIAIGLLLVTAARLAVGPVFGLLIIGAILVGARLDLKARIRTCLLVAAWLVPLLALHFLLIADPRTSWRIIEETSRLAVVQPTVGAPVSELIRWSVSGLLTGLPQRLVLLAIPIVIGSAFPLFALLVKPAERKTVVVVSSCVGLLIVLFTAFGLGKATESIVAGGPQTTWTALLITALLQATLCVVLGWRPAGDEPSESPPDRPESNRPTSRFLLGMVALLLACAGVFGITSNNGLLIQSGLCLVLAAFATLIAVAWISTFATPRATSVLAATVGVCVLLTAGGGLSHAKQAPYRTAPATASDMSAEITWRGARIDLSPAEAISLTALEDAAIANGFTPGTPLADLTPFHPGIAYRLNAMTPPSILLGWNSAQAVETLKSLDAEVWCGAWLIANYTSSISPEAMGALGMRFPDDYSYVAGRTRSHPEAAVLPDAIVLFKPIPEAVQRCRSEGRR